MPETELSILARMLEGLNATRSVPATTLVPPPAPHYGQSRPLPKASGPIKPVSKPIRPPAPHAPPATANAPLANQYGMLMRQEESPEHNNLLRKVMFARVSDLISWVNKS